MPRRSIALTHAKAEESELELDSSSFHLITPPSSPVFKEMSFMQPRFSLTDDNYQLAPYGNCRVHFHLPNPHLSAEIPRIEIIVHKETRIEIIVHKETRIEEAGDDNETAPSIVVHTGHT